MLEALLSISTAAVLMMMYDGDCDCCCCSYVVQLFTLHHVNVVSKTFELDFGLKVSYHDHTITEDTSDTDLWKPQFWVTNAVGTPLVKDENVSIVDRHSGLVTIYIRQQDTI